MKRQRLASFATVGVKGEPHVVPVFFTYENGKVFVQTDRKFVKVRNLMKNPSVAVAVYGEEEAVIIRGKARIIESDEEFAKRTEEHVDKYGPKLNSQGRDSLGIPLFDREIRYVVEVSPEKVMFW